MLDKKMNPYGKYMKGSQSTIVELGYFAEKNENGLQDLLIRATGKPAVDEGVDGAVLKCKAVAGPNGGVDYQYDREGKTYTRMSMRKNWGNQETWEIYLSTETIVLEIDEKMASEVKPLHLLTEFEKTN